MSVSARSGHPPTGSLAEEAEALLQTLTGVRGVRIVTGSGGEISEIHVLTGEEISPKQTVRNVESALLAHLNIPIDHRKVSVAQSDSGEMLSKGKEGTLSLVLEKPAIASSPRILYRTHQAVTEGSQRARLSVTLEWRAEAYDGSAVSADLPRPRVWAAAEATLRAVEAILEANRPQGPDGSPILTLEGAKAVNAFDQEYAFVVVQALVGREVLALTGATPLKGAPEAPFVLAALQATDRWARGQLE